MKDKFIRIYDSLYGAFGPQHWWPAETPFEVCVGAILTQSTNWRNVEKAIENLKDAGLLHPEGLLEVKEERLAQLIRPAGYYNAKARKLKSFVSFLQEGYDGRLEDFFRLPVGKMRSELLSVWGIGPETADSIILYAAQKPSFVVDAYTKRICGRIGLLNGDSSYDYVKAFFEDNLPKKEHLYNEYHALIVRLAKEHCRTKPECAGCPLKRRCKTG